MIVCWLALLAQDTVHLTRVDDRKPLYEGLLRRVAEARAALDERPAEAARLLDRVIAEAGDGPIECRIRIERLANDFGEAQDFFPRQLRGRARMALAATAGAGARTLLAAALADFDASPVPSSEPLRREALRRLWDAVRPELAFDAEGPDPEARAVFDRIGDAEWLEAEAARATAVLDAATGRPEDAHPPARRILAWSRAFGATALAARAEAALARRSRFRLQVAVHPFAELVSIRREGTEMRLDVRHTPLVLELEAGAFEVELRHPRWGVRRARFGPDDVGDGKAYALSGDMESGRLGLHLLPR